MISMIPYGRLANGNYGTNIDETTGVTKASVVEILATLPAVAEPDNFAGRLVFSLNTKTLYVYVDIPPRWQPLDGVPATIAAVNGNPPIVPQPPSGDMLYDTDTQVLFLYDGTQWSPIGGRFAAQIITQRFVGDGLTTTYPLGVSIGVPPEYVEAFWDGVRQYPNPSGDFNIVGTNIVFSVPVPSNVIIYLRTTISDPLGMVQNAQIVRTSYVASAGETDFGTGVAGASLDSIFVFTDGALQSDLVDYSVTQQDTSIVSIVKTFPTVATATTTTPHGLVVGSQITLGGIVEPEYYGSIIVSATPSPTTFEYTIIITAGASATPDPIMYFAPSQTMDTVVFGVPLAGGEVIEIRVIKNTVVSPQNGEANTGANTGSGVGVYNTKAGEVLQFKSLVAGNNQIILDNGSEVIISSTSGATSESRSGINAFYYLVPPSDSYVGVRDTTSPVTIDLASIINDPSESGRRIVITDESGGAAINNISIIASGSLISGISPPYIINNNYGSVTMVKDGTNWYITAKI